MSVSGAVATPASYTRAQLQAMPQTTLPDTRSTSGGTVTGVLLADLVTASTPVLPDAKNAQPRISITVAGGSGARTLAFGELDPGSYVR